MPSNILLCSIVPPIQAAALKRYSLHGSASTLVWTTAVPQGSIENWNPSESKPVDRSVSNFILIMNVWGTPDVLNLVAIFGILNSIWGLLGTWVKNDFNFTFFSVFVSWVSVQQTLLAKLHSIHQTVCSMLRKCFLGLQFYQTIFRTPNSFFDVRILNLQQKLWMSLLDKFGVVQLESGSRPVQSQG